MIRSIVSAPITVVMLPVRVARFLAGMRFSTVLAIITGGAAAFTAARRLMAREDAVTELPEGLQEPALRAQSVLVDSRGRLARAMEEAGEEQANAKDELRQEYLRKTGRLTD